MRFGVAAAAFFVDRCAEQRRRENRLSFSRHSLCLSFSFTSQQHSLDLRGIERARAGEPKAERKREQESAKSLGF